MPVAVTRTLRSDAAFRAALFLLGFLLSWLPLVIAPTTLPVVDEQFQFLEAGHRLVFGYGMVPWEFDYHARSWALGYLAAPPMALAALLGAGPHLYIPLIWAEFSLLSGGMTLCAGLWGARAFGRWGGIVTALVAASWIDNLYFGGRVLSETVGAHLLIIAVFLAEPGYRVTDRRRMALAGFLATAAVLLRVQLGPAALLLWLWRWRDGRRFAWLSTGALAALVLNGAFDALTADYPFQPLWQNFRFNVLLNGAVTFGDSSWSFYFEDFWRRWGLTALPFTALALLGGRRAPLLLAMAAAIIVIHVFIPHKEYRFLLPAILMASILCGLGLMEAVSRARMVLERRQGRRAATAAMLLAGIGWTGVALGNAAKLDTPQWSSPSALVEMAMEMSKLRGICGIGFGNLFAFQSGAYTFLHQKLPTFYSRGVEQEAFIRARPGYDAFVTRKGDLEFFESFRAFDDYRLDHCNDEVCLFIRPGGCTGRMPAPPPIGDLGAKVGQDPRYPYAAGIQP